MASQPRWATVFLVAVLAACAPAAVPSAPGASAGATAAVAPATLPTRLVVGVGADTPHLATKLDPESGSFRYDLRFMLNSPLAVLDERGGTHALLASEIPSRDGGTWTVNADGTMATTWRIRPNAVWHDGQPVTSRDFAFALRVYQDADLQIYERPVNLLMDHLESRDDKTFVIYWKRIHLRADRLITGDFEPLPEHLAGALYDSGEKASFQIAPLWTSTAYVGNGPYRIAEWEKGAQSVYRAFDGFFLGRPQIDEVVFQVVSDQNTAVAHLLGGTIDFTSPQTLNTQAGLTAKGEWDRSGEGRVLQAPAVMRQVWIQYHPARVVNPALRDVRLRRALVHAIDRASLADVVSGGASPVAEALVAPADPLYPRVQQAIISYPFDRTRALALLAEVGWTRSPAGALVDSRGEQFAIEYLTSRVSDNVTEMEIIGNDLAAIGFNVAQVAYAQRSRTNEEEASFPGLFFTPIRNMQVPEGLSEFTTDQCPTAERRFIGNNRACWNDPEYERLFSVASAAFGEGERANATVDALKVLTQGVPVIPLSYNIEYVGVRKGLQGPVPRWPAQRGYTWNIHEWRWT